MMAYNNMWTLNKHSLIFKISDTIRSALVSYNFHLFLLPFGARILFNEFHTLVLECGYVTFYMYLAFLY